MASRLLRRADARRTANAGAANPAIVLAIILGCYLMVVLDASVVITALPDIRTDLGFSPASLSWVQNIYALAFGGLLLLGARAGDLLGRRQVFVIGITIFTAASMLGGLAQSETWLLAARAIQGVGAAIAAPSTLALLTISFPEGSERTRAIALYSAVASAGASIGLILGGMLTTWISWRWSLFINVPIGVVLVSLAPRYLPETERHTGEFDIGGAADLDARHERPRLRPRAGGGNELGRLGRAALLRPRRGDARRLRHDRETGAPADHPAAPLRQP